MAKMRKKNLCILLCVLLTALLLVFTSMQPCVSALAQDSSVPLSDSTGMKASYVTTYDGSKDMPQAEDNDWQIVREPYKEVKQGSKYTYSEEDAVRVQKAVMANETENDFQVYLNVEPQLSWEEFFKSLDNYATHV